ncbi:transmembrane protein 216-like [Amphibalanus amphitrite]|nr:transmembrane protein 216-like [Amphibalanus amphitrite]XP_043225108.1 transmembrane protein 216-like [Amphibalanus amphitrite]XP_043225109.1 transmembrane protein 216-like [Amphibalanus amphitrite]
MGSSLAYEVLAYLHGWYTAAYVCLTLLLLLWKRSVLPYPPVNLVSELALLLLLAAAEAARLLLSRRGNLTLRVLPLLVGALLAAPSALAVCYFLLWQTYVLRLELVLCATQLVFIGVETLLAAGCMVAFSRE